MRSTALSRLCGTNFPRARATTRLLHFPSARFTVLGIGSPGTFTYRVAGVARFSVPEALPVRLEESAGAASSHTTMHIARGSDGGYRWFGNCTVGAG
ncbi:MAG TPA: hypothetical protein VMQ40_06665 [Acidimicrobiales bacterium]|jgi:hypothetical protein|nr:hypothetical protein [Acidimicrobiales bacterium]